jgi:siroheme synthase-like protein
LRYFPVHLDLRERHVVVVGAGAVAAGKISQLLDAEALVTVVAPEVIDDVRALRRDSKIELHERAFEPADLEGATLVIGATDERGVNQRIAEAAREKGVMCNIVDDPELCDFITPALVIRGDLQIGISTSGGSPTLAQRVKREIDSLIGEEYGQLLELAAEMRREARSVIPDFEERRDVLRAFVESQALDLVREGRLEDARALARSFLRGSNGNGTDTIVGSRDQRGGSEIRGELDRDYSRMGSGRVW